MPCAEAAFVSGNPAHTKPRHKNITFRKVTIRLNIEKALGADLGHFKTKSKNMKKKHDKIVFMAMPLYGHKKRYRGLL